MKYRLHFSRHSFGEIDDNGTNYLINEFPPGRNTVDWEILDSAAGAAFIDAFALVEDAFDKTLAWNCYTKENSFQAADRAEKIKQLNIAVQYCIDNEHIPFTEDDKIYEGIERNEMLKRLNKIHYEFESKLVLIQEERKEDPTKLADPGLVSVLEKLNSLVHTLEKSPNDTPTEQFFAIRYSARSVVDKFAPITDDIYNEFTTNVHNGDLYSDFFTVGKDLGHAFYTNDVELVHNKEIKQQSVVSAAVSFALNKRDFQTPNDVVNPVERQRYLNWCDHHRVDEYGYEYTEPKYNLGRAPIGKLIDLDYEGLKAILEESPYITKVELVE